MEFRNSSSGHENTIQSLGKSVDQKNKRKSADPLWEKAPSKELVIETIPESQKFSITKEQFDNWHSFRKKIQGIRGDASCTDKDAIAKAAREYPEGYNIEQALKTFIEDNLIPDNIKDARNRNNRNERKYANRKHNIRDIHIQDIIAYYCKLHLNREEHRSRGIKTSGTTAETPHQGRTLKKQDRSMYTRAAEKYQQGVKDDWAEWESKGHTYTYNGSDEEDEADRYFGDDD